MGNVNDDQLTKYTVVVALNGYSAFVSIARNTVRKIQMRAKLRILNLVTGVCFLGPMGVVEYCKGA